jgi:hypothetical protein
MCIDYSSLNKVYPKDEYPCLIFVRSLIPQRRVNYCHFWMPIQAIIKLASPLTTKKIVFITPFGIFCYTKMAFALKNGAATYQKCIHIIFEPQIRRHVEAYIDDVVVKLKSVGIYLTASKRYSTIFVSTR